MLNIPGWESNQLFKHSKEYEQGLGKIRKGAHNFVVALDGSGDFDTIQSAINALPATGGGVFVKEGTYTISAPIKIPSYVTLQGVGRGTIIFQSSGTAGDFINNSNTTSGNKQIVIRDLTIKLINAASGTGIVLTKVKESLLHNILFISDVSMSPCIWFNTCSHNTVSDCMISGNYDEGNGGILLSGSSNNIIHGTTFNGDYYDCAGGIILDSASHKNTIANNNLTMTVGYTGIDVSGDQNVITGNFITGCTEAVALDITATADRTLVVGNISYGNAGGNYNNAGTNTTASGNITA